MRSQVGCEYVASEQIQGFAVLIAVQTSKYIAAFGVQDAHGLGEMMPLLKKMGEGGGETSFTRWRIK